jgi:hypothetical protein
LDATGVGNENTTPAVHGPAGYDTDMTGTVPARERRAHPV